MYEPSSKRVSVFALVGNGVRTIVPIIEGGATLDRGGVTAHGLLAAITSRTPGISYYVIHVSDAGKILDTLLAIPPRTRPLAIDGRQAGVRNGPRISITYLYQPLVDTDKYVTAHDGMSVVALTSSTSGPSLNRAVTLASIDLRGDTIWKRRLSWTARAITDAEFNTVIDSLAKPSSYKNERSAMDRKALVDSVIRPRTWPPVDQLQVGTDGSIWLKQGGPPARQALYWRLSPMGDVEATVAMPAGFHPVVFSKSLVWGWRRDADDLEIVERHRIK